MVLLATGCCQTCWWDSRRCHRSTAWRHHPPDAIILCQSQYCLWQLYAAISAKSIKSPRRRCPDSSLYPFSGLTLEQVCAPTTGPATGSSTTPMTRIAEVPAADTARHGLPTDTASSDLPDSRRRHLAYFDGWEPFQTSIIKLFVLRDKGLTQLMQLLSSMAVVRFARKFWSLVDKAIW